MKSDEKQEAVVKERKTLTYDVWGQLETVQGVLWDTALYQSQTLYVITYGYDVMGRRVKRVCNDGTNVTTTFYDYDGDTLIGEANGGSVASSGFGDGGGGGGFEFLRRNRANRPRGPNAEAWFHGNSENSSAFDPLGLFEPTPEKAVAPAAAFSLMARFQTGGGYGGYRSYYTGITGIIGSSYTDASGRSSNASYYQYDAGGNTQYEWETAGTQRWMRLQGLDAWGRPLNQGGNSSNPQPTNVFGSGGYRDPATGMVALTS